MSQAHRDDRPAPAAASRRADDPYGRRIFFRGLPHEGVGKFRIECMHCTRVTRQTIIDLGRAHFPFFLWMPLARYGHYARCPACGTRSWLRVHT